MSEADTNRGTPLAVTVIGGYLGAGKTTLVNHLLRQANGVRLAVLVNEFGSLPIDADLIEAEDENIISIAGGCVCCSYGNDLILALIDLAGMTPRPNHVLLEASGVALPGAIAGSIGLLTNMCWMASSCLPTPKRSVSAHTTRTWATRLRVSFPMQIFCC